MIPPRIDNRFALVDPTLPFQGRENEYAIARLVAGDKKQMGKL